LVKIIEEVVAKGYKVVVLPNGTAWGTKKIADGLMKMLPEGVRDNVVIGPEPTDPRMFKNFVGYSDYVLTVEGGMMHMAFNMGKPFGIILRFGAGAAKWIPYGRSSSTQNIVRNVGDTVGAYRGRWVGQDKAMFSNTDKGGIDLASAGTNLQVQNAGEGIKFRLDPAMLKQLQNASGFVPVIISIQPIMDFRQFLKK
jgi:hypothetical protein